MEVSLQEGETELSKDGVIKFKGGFAILRQEGGIGCIKSDGLECGPRLCEEAVSQLLDGGHILRPQAH